MAKIFKDKNLNDKFEYLNNNARLRDVTASVERHHLRFFVHKVNKMGYFKILEDIRKNTTKKSIPKFAKTNATVDEMVEKAIDFFLQLDDGIYQRVNAALEEKSVTQNFHEPGALSKTSNVISKRRFFKPNIREINLFPNESILGFVEVVHEFAHSGTQKFLKCKRPKTELTAEIPSLFMEKVFKDFLFKSGKIDESTYDNLCTLDSLILLKNINGMFVEKDLCNVLPHVMDTQNFTSVVKFLVKRGGKPEKISVMLDEMKRLADEDSKYHGEYRCRYVIGELVSSVLFDDFKKNPQEVLEKYKYFADHICEMKLDESCKFLLGENYKNRIVQKFCVKEEIK